MPFGGNLQRDSAGQLALIHAPVRFSLALPKRLRHPVTPLLLYLVITQVVRDQYPISHYPMYSKPNAEAVEIQFLADGQGQPLPIMFHTGLSPAQLSKLVANRSKKLPTREEAGRDVLKYLREMNAQRPRRPLPAHIQLIDATLAFADGHLTESHHLLAEDTSPSQP